MIPHYRIAELSLTVTVYVVVYTVQYGHLLYDTVCMLTHCTELISFSGKHIASFASSTKVVT